MRTNEVNGARHRRVIGSLCAALALAAAPAWADNQRGFYAGVGFAMAKGDHSTPYDSAEMPAVELSGGYKYNGLLGAEARFGVGLNDDRDTDSDYFQAAVADNPDLTQVDRELGQFAAIYYRPELINDKARLYGLIGYAELDADITRWEGLDSTTTTDTLSGASYGIGVGWYVDQRLNFNIEYRQLVRTDHFRFETLSAQFDYRF